MKQIISFLVTFCLLLQHSILVAAIAEGQNPSLAIRTLDEGPIHEGFVTKATPITLLDAIDQEPPIPLMEKIPAQFDPNSEWIPGYWDWSKKHKKFIWISGVWRRPPPGHQWIPTQWKKQEQGWVRFPGFWSNKPLSELNYITLLPPDLVDEQVVEPPTSGYFWAPGYWQYIAQKHDFTWKAGQWIPLDPNWVLIPARYTWRPGGYVFLPAHWDWPLDSLGRAYADISIVNAASRGNVVYEPVKVLNNDKIIETLLPYYPDYLSYFNHHWFYHPEFWLTFAATPPWWSWTSWWAYTWQDQWALWWWYAHQGYPQPYWLTRDITDKLPPPSPTTKSLLLKVKPPLFVTPKGVVSSAAIVKSASQLFGKKVDGKEAFEPVIANDLTTIKKVRRLANKQLAAVNKLLQPVGSNKSFDKLRLNPPNKVTLKDSAQEIFKDKFGNGKIVKLKVAKIPSKPRLGSSMIPLITSPTSSPSGDVAVNDEAADKPSKHEKVKANAGKERLEPSMDDKKAEDDSTDTHKPIVINYSVPKPQPQQQQVEPQPFQQAVYDYEPSDFTPQEPYHEVERESAAAYCQQQTPTQWGCSETGASQLDYNEPEAPQWCYSDAETSQFDSSGLETPQWVYSEPETPQFEDYATAAPAVRTLSRQKPSNIPSDVQPLKLFKAKAVAMSTGSKVSPKVLKPAPAPCSGEAAASAIPLGKKCGSSPVAVMPRGRHCSAAAFGSPPLPQPAVVSEQQYEPMNCDYEGSRESFPSCCETGSFSEAFNIAEQVGIATVALDNFVD